MTKYFNIFFTYLCEKNDYEANFKSRIPNTFVFTN